MEAESLNPLLEKYKKTITKEITKKICERYCIYDKEDRVNQDEIIGYLSKLNNVVKKRCSGVSITGVPKQCSKFAIEKFYYCKTHMMAYGKVNSTRHDDIELVQEKKCNEGIDLSKLKKKFIGDSFYYIDSLFIYDDFNEKVGYIDNNEYHLTDDPYILGI